MRLTPHPSARPAPCATLVLTPSGTAFVKIVAVPDSLYRLVLLTSTFPPASQPFAKFGLN